MTEETPTDQVVVGDFKSKHFDICPSAVALYKDIEHQKIIESGCLRYVCQSRKKAIAANMATQDQVDKTQHYADMIMKLAEEMDLEDEHDSAEDVHIAKMKEF